MSAQANNLQKSFSVAMVLVLLGLFAFMIAGFFGALVFAAASALMFYPLQLKLQARISPGKAALLNLLLLLFLIIAPAVSLLGLAVTQAVSIGGEASNWLNTRLADGVELPSWLPFTTELDTMRSELTSKAGEVAAGVGRFVVASLSQVTQATGLFLLDVFVAAYFFFYCLLNGQSLVQRVVSGLPLNQTSRAHMVHVVSSVTRSVLKSMIVIGFVQAVFSGFAFWVVDVEAFVFWGVIMGFLSVIPFIGPIIIWLPVAIYLAVTGDYGYAIFLAVWFWLIVASIDNVMRPPLIGADTQMPEVLVLLTTLGGLFVFGAIGLIVGPLIGALFMASWSVYQETFADELDIEPAQDAVGEKP